MPKIVPPLDNSTASGVATPVLRYILVCGAAAAVPVKVTVTLLVPTGQEVNNRLNALGVVPAPAVSSVLA
ncbi:hypothetical protein D3C81_2209770 [compost metagenome]